MRLGLDGGDASFETTAPTWTTWDSTHLAEHRRDGEVAGQRRAGSAGQGAAEPMALVRDNAEDGTAMTAYVISEIETTDPAIVEEYRALARESVAEFGGGYVVRNKVAEPLEGEWPESKSIVVLSSPSVQRARDWYHSATYTRAIGIARRSMGPADRDRGRHSGIGGR